MLKVKMQIPVWVRLTDKKFDVQYRHLTRGYPITIQGMACASHLSTNPKHNGKDLWRVTELKTGCMVGSTITGRKLAETVARAEAKAMERKLKKSLKELTQAQLERLPNLLDLPNSLVEAQGLIINMCEAQEKYKNEKKTNNEAKELSGSPVQAKKSRRVRGQEKRKKQRSLS